MQKDMESDASFNQHLSYLRHDFRILVIPYNEYTGEVQKTLDAKEIGGSWASKRTVKPERKHPYTNRHKGGTQASVMMKRLDRGWTKIALQNFRPKGGYRNSLKVSILGARVELARPCGQGILIPFYRKNVFDFLS